MCELLALSSAQPDRPPTARWYIFSKPGGASTGLAIPHIRHATRGDVSLANTQPFVCEFGGHMHVFAHNGDLPDIESSGTMESGACRSVSQTDSEHAVCVLLARLNTQWLKGGLPPLEGRLPVVASFAADLRALGPANFLYADGDALFAHGDRRLQRSGRAEPPGLWMRQRRCPPEAAFDDQRAGVTVRTNSTAVTWVASVPLTDDPWEPLERGEWVAIRGGEIVSADRPFCAHDHAL